MMLKKHLVKVGNLCDVNQVDHSKVLHFLCDAVQSLVHLHTLSVSIASETQNYDTIIL